MPKHKLNLNPAEELVPIDDSGPEVDVELPEDAVPSFEAVTPSKPILENEPEEAVEAVEEKDEHEEYSKNVKKTNRQTNRKTARSRKKRTSSDTIRKKCTQGKRNIKRAEAEYRQQLYNCGSKSNYRRDRGNEEFIKISKRRTKH